MQPCVIRVDHLPPEGETFDLRLDAEQADDLLRARGMPHSLEARPLTARVRLVPGGDDVFVLGELTGAIAGPCSRCLETCEQSLIGEFHLNLVGDVAHKAGGETELHREDLDLELLRGGEIDLVEVLAEQVLLRLPSHPVCTTECRGLCPVCGSNRNLTACDCDDSRPDPRFAALAGLRHAGTSCDD